MRLPIGNGLDSTDKSFSSSQRPGSYRDYLGLSSNLFEMIISLIERIRFTNMFTCINIKIDEKGS